MPRAIVIREYIIPFNRIHYINEVPSLIEIAPKQYKNGKEIRIHLTAPEKVLYVKDTTKEEWSDLANLMLKGNENVFEMRGFVIPVERIVYAEKEVWAEKLEDEERYVDIEHLAIHLDGLEEPLYIRCISEDEWEDFLAVLLD